MNLPYIHLQTTTSTNDIAMQYAAEGIEEGTAIIADYQTKGRGQQGNSWESVEGENILFSVIFYPHFLPVKHFFLLSQITALAVIDFLQLHKVDANIKWPNDILVKKQKICGILIEQSFTGNGLDYSIIGIGLNLNQKNFSGMNVKATSLALETGEKHDRISAFQQFHRQLFYRYQQLQKYVDEDNIEPIMSEYMDKLFGFNTLNKYRIVENNEDIEGKITNVSTQGILTLETETQTLFFANKEIEFKL